MQAFQNPAIHTKREAQRNRGTDHQEQPPRGCEERWRYFKDGVDVEAAGDRDGQRQQPHAGVAEQAGVNQFSQVFVIAGGREL